jgi:phage-related protein
MPKNLTNNQIQEIEKSELKTRILVTIDLDDAPLRLLENDTLQVLNIDGKDYVAAMVKRGDIETSMGGTLERVNITISNILQEISGLIAREGDTLTNRKCIIEEIIFEGDTSTIIDDPVLLFEGVINNIQLTAVAFSFDVERVLGGYTPVGPNTTYDVNCQWKFKDARCQYSGTENPCDKTLGTCRIKERFGGYPSIPKQMVISAQ